MRIVSWNINGIRTLPQYHPWNTLKTFDDILNHLQADVICFQEVKSSRSSLPKQVALPDSYNSFFSFPLYKTGYSGVVTYTRTDSVIPLKAEEGLTGLIQPRPPFSEEERISRSGSYPPDVADPDKEEVNYKDLDSEGRAVLVDFGLFVLINVYCPNDGSGSTERESFKMNYHRTLEARVDGLIQEGREVIVVGDLNACAAVEDHCEGPLMVARGLAERLQGEEGFWGKEYRRWIRDWLIKDDGTGSLIDIVRKLWPDRKGMYTCWNTKISARETNYGTRIDFILITPGLVPWIEAADIQPHVKGSDHCPVFVDLRDEITNSDGSLTKLADVLGVPSVHGLLTEPPRLAAKYWDEHKQRLLSTFFVKKSDGPSPAPPPYTSSQQISKVQSVNNTHDVADGEPESSSQTPPTARASTKRRILTTSSPTPPSTKKAKTSSQNHPAPSKPKRKTVGNSTQSTIASFFLQQSQFPPATPTSVSVSRPTTTCNNPSSSLSLCHRSQQRPPPTSLSQPLPTAADLQIDEAEFFLANSEPQHPSSPSEKDKSKQAWRSFLAPTQIPKCAMHNEPAKEYTVNKPGPNKGKRFFICSRPVGPGYDKGRAERLREQVNPQFRCNFFKWSSEVRKQTRTESKEQI